MGRAIVLSSTKLALLVIAALFAGYLLGNCNTSNSNQAGISGTALRSTSGIGNGSGGALFVLLVNLKFANLAHRDTFLELIEPVCKDVRSNEGPGTGSAETATTLSYKVAISDKDPLMLAVIERYSDKDHGYLKVHRSGVEFLKYRDEVKGMQERGEVAIEGESYLETDLGFV